MICLRAFGIFSGQLILIRLYGEYIFEAKFKLIILTFDTFSLQFFHEIH